MGLASEKKDGVFHIGSDNIHALGVGTNEMDVLKGPSSVSSTRLCKSTRSGSLTFKAGQLDSLTGTHTLYSNHFA